MPKLKIKRARTSAGFNFALRRKRSFTGKPLIELADSGFRNHDLRLTVKQVGSARRYKATYYDSEYPTKLLKEHQRFHARQIVFHHERGFPLNSNSMLAKLEEELSSVYVPPKPVGIVNIQQLKEDIAAEHLSLLGFIDKLHSMFPTTRRFMHSLAKMTKKGHHMRLVLEELNKMNYLSYDSNKLNQLYFQLIDYLHEEARKAHARVKP